MWTAENNVGEIASQHAEFGNRVRSSLIQAAVVPHADESRSSRKSKQGSVNSESKAVLKAITKNRFQQILKFEIILDKRKKPEELERALAQYSKDSLNSLRRGFTTPSIKEYVDVNSFAYEPGDVLSGHVELRTSGNLSIKCINVRIRGTYIVAFESRVEGESITSTEQLTFLDETKAVFSADPDKNFVDVSSGYHIHPFDFTLPSTIPGTMFFERFQTLYEGASVVYSIEAHLNIFENLQLSMAPSAKDIFMVVRKLRGARASKYHKQYCISKNNKLRFCCYKLGRISVGVTLKRLAFTEGDAIMIEVLTMNDSTMAIKQIDIALVQHTLCRTKNLAAICLQARTTLIHHSIPMDLGAGDSFNELALTLPEEMQPSTEINNCPEGSVTVLDGMARDSSDDNPVKTLPVDLNSIKLEEKSEKTATPQIIDYSQLYSISYFLQVKVRTNREWFDMKGPEIKFPITILASDSDQRVVIRNPNIEDFPAMELKKSRNPVKVPLQTEMSSEDEK